MASSKLISPNLIAEMKAELEDLSKTEPGAKNLKSVITELLPLIQGCRERGHSWKKISESLQKFHSDLTLSKLKRIAFELEPSLKGSAKTPAIPKLDDGDVKKVDQQKSQAKKSVVDFEDEL